MNRSRFSLLGGTLLLLLVATPATAQGYRVRLDSRLQGISWRGLTSGSIPRADAIEQPNGGFLTAEGYGAVCGPVSCTFFAPGPVLRGVPWVTQGDVTVWGLGIPGLSLRANGRWASDFGDQGSWPGTEPAVQLVEGYLEYARQRVTLRAGRQYLPSRLGAYGLDGARATMRDVLRGIEVTGYLGWGLARGVALPVTDPALNPLQEFQPRDRQIVAGMEAGVTSRLVDARLEYRREVDPAVDYFVSERAAASLSLRPLRRLTVTAGGEYDLAFGQAGSADVTIGWIGNDYTLTTGWRRYRPFFDLWTIWGAFSPVPHHTLHASASVTPVSSLTFRMRGERYQFEDAEVNTPSVSIEDRGWRMESGATWTPALAWIVNGGYHTEFGPGASSRGFSGRVTWLPSDQLSISAHGDQVKRPLELRYNDAELRAIGLDTEYRPNPRWRVGFNAAQYAETRARPDASALDWDQLRVTARVTILFGSNADRSRLPPAVRSAAGRTP